MANFKVTTTGIPFRESRFTFVGQGITEADVGKAATIVLAGDANLVKLAEADEPILGRIETVEIDFDSQYRQPKHKPNLCHQGHANHRVDNHPGAGAHHLTNSIRGHRGHPSPVGGSNLWFDHSPNRSHWHRSVGGAHCQANRGDGSGRCAGLEFDAAAVTQHNTSTCADVGTNHGTDV